MKNNWQTKKLAEICSLFADGDWIEKKDQSSEGIRLVQTGNVGNSIFKDRAEKARYISEKTFKRLRCTEILPGDCLISRLPDPIGRSCILPKTGIKMITAVDCTIIRFKRKVILSQWFVYYSLSHEYQDQINKQISGATRQRISRSNLGLIEIPLPPISEQKQIVETLNEVFAKTAKVQENTEKNLQNFHELFKSYLQGIFANQGKDWEKKKLGEVAKVIGGYSFKSTDFRKQGKYQVIRIGNVRPGIIRTNESPIFIDSIGDNVLKRALLLTGDVIITQTGTKNKRDYGFTAIIDKDNYLLNQRISAIRFADDYLPKFFLFFSWTNYFKNQYFANETGTVGQGNIGIGAITGAIIPFPSLKEQKAIVRKLDLLLIDTKKLKNNYERKLTYLLEFKKSILKTAFNNSL